MGIFTIFAEMQAERAKEKYKRGYEHIAGLLLSKQASVESIEYSIHEVRKADTADEYEDGAQAALDDWAALMYFLSQRK